MKWPQDKPSGRPREGWPGHPDGGRASLAGEVASQKKSGPRRVGSSGLFSLCFHHCVEAGQPSSTFD